MKYTLLSVFLQSTKPDIIAVFLSIEEFPRKRDDLPITLKILESLHLIQIHFVTQNLRAYKKLIYALQAFSDDILITIDDDQFYDKDTLKLLLDSYRRFPHCIHTHALYECEAFRAMTQTNAHIDDTKEDSPTMLGMPVGVSGVLYPPHCLHRDITKSEVFMKLAPYSDDLWFWAMSVRAGTPKVLVRHHLSHSYNWTIAIYESPHLYMTNVEQNQNFTQMQNILTHYKEIKEMLLNNG